MTVLPLYFSFMLQVLSFSLELAVSKGREETYNLQTSVYEGMNISGYWLICPMTNI